MKDKISIFRAGKDAQLKVLYMALFWAIFTSFAAWIALVVCFPLDSQTWFLSAGAGGMGLCSGLGWHHNKYTGLYRIGTVIGLLIGVVAGNTLGNGGPRDILILGSLFTALGFLSTYYIPFHFGRNLNP